MNLMHRRFLVAALAAAVLSPAAAFAQDSAAAGSSKVAASADTEFVRNLKATRGGDISVGGPTLAAQAIAAGLVDEYQLFLVPVVVGGGKHFLPGGVRTNLELLDERRFGNGTVYLRYGTSAKP